MMTQNREVPVVLGTAGHIDHGKTTLVKALTGVDCDRLRDEKRRGITIELGFAPVTLPGGQVVSIVDVPGHEKFIRQMVAGAAGIDGVLFIIAADEGVRAQTREHLDILGLIGVRHGIVVVTKADMVDPDFLDLALEEIREEIEGTFLKGAEIIPVSAVSGFNLDKLMESIGNMVGKIIPRNSGGGFFMPVDRVFPVKGFGSVVTGTAYRGSVRKDDPLELLPPGLKTEIRSVQVHDVPVETGTGGQRIAMSLGGISLDEISRGDVLCTPGVFSATERFDVRLSILPSSPEAVEHWQRVRMHLGTADLLGRVSFFDREKLEPGDTAFAQIVAEEPVVCTRDEAFVIRFYSPLRTIGGGTVVMPLSRRPRGHKEKISHLAFLKKISTAADTEERFKELSSHMKLLPVREAISLLQEVPSEFARIAKEADRKGRSIYIETGEGLVISGEYAREKLAETKVLLDGMHEKEPENPGMVADVLCRKLFPEIDIKYSKRILDKWVENGEVALDDRRVSIPGFTPRDASQLGASGRTILEYCSRREFQPPTLDEISEGTALSAAEIARSLEALRAQGQITLAGGEFLVSRNVLEKLVEKLAGAGGDITVASVRDLTGSSRKYVLPMLEMLDSMGITRRVQDKRILRKTKV